MSETKDQSDAAILKKKKRRLKEGEESWRCSNGQNGDIEMGEPSPKKNATDNGKEGKRGAGVREPETVHVIALKVAPELLTVFHSQPPW